MFVASRKQHDKATTSLHLQGQSSAKKNMKFRVIAALLAALLIFSFTQNIFAQNIQRIEEEAIKDKERDEKLKKYLEEREQQEKELLSKPVTIDDLQKQNLVEVEPTNILPSDLVSAYALVPYKIRRARWGHLFSVTYSMYNPDNYQTDYLSPTQGDFDSLYGTAQTPFLELGYTYKWNFNFGSIGLDLGYAFYENDAADEILGDAKLSIHNFRIGAKYVADAFALEPRIAPYVMGGGYTLIYTETQGNATLDGTTLIAPYYGFGALFQLGWIDPAAALDAYTESQIENTFVFLEMRQYMASSDENDPDFSTGLEIGGGLSLEF